MSMKGMICKTLNAYVFWFLKSMLKFPKLDHPCDCQVILLVGGPNIGYRIYIIKKLSSWSCQMCQQQFYQKVFLIHWETPRFKPGKALMCLLADILSPVLAWKTHYVGKDRRKLNFFRQPIQELKILDNFIMQGSSVAV